MSHRHALDANTHALYRCDEASSNIGSYAVAAEYNSVYDLAQGTASNQPLILGGYPSQVVLDDDGEIAEADYCRWFYGGGQTAGRFLTASGDAAAAAALVADFTVEAWVWLEDSDHSNTIVIYGSDSTGEANNYLLGFYIEADRGFRVFYQRAGGSAVNTSTAGGYVPLRQWVHVAMRVTVAGGTRTSEFFVDGVDVEDDIVDDNAADGTNVGWRVGSNIVNSIEFEGGIAALRVWSRPLTDQETADLAATEVSTDLAGIDDSDLLAGWHFAEPPMMHDIGPYGLHLRQLSATSLVVGASPLVGEGRAIYVDSSVTGYFGPKRQEWLDRLQGAAEWTIEVWTRHVGGGSPSSSFDHGLAGYDGGNSESVDRNALLRLMLDQSTGPWAPFSGWESGSAANQVEQSTNSMFSDDERFDLHHLAVVKRSVGGGQSEVDWYHNGVFFETLGPFDDPVDGGNPELGAFYAFTSGPVNIGVGTVNPGSHGYWDDMRVSSVARGAAEILESYETGIAHGGGAHGGGAQVSRLNPEIVRSSP